MNRKIRVTIFLVFVLSLSCSLVSAAYVENPLMPDMMPDIKVDIESHPQVVEWKIDQPNNDMDFPENGDVHVVVYEGRAKDVVILDRTPWKNGADFCVVHIVDIYYYTVHTYSRENDEWTREVVGVAKDVRSELVSIPKDPSQYDQNEEPLALFNENLSDRYNVVWDSVKETYVTRDKYRV